MKHYLLGDLGADERMALEERLLFSEELHLELLIIEQELIDEYVTGSLSPTERKGFEAHFLEDAFRQEQLRFGKSFNAYLLDSRVEPTPATTTVRHTPAPLPVARPAANNPPVNPLHGRTTLLGAGLVIILGVVLAGSYLRTLNRTTIDPIATVVVPLDSGSTRSDGALKRVQAPPPNSEVRLELKVPVVTYDHYKAELFKEQTSVNVHDNLKAEPQGTQHVVPVVVESEILEPGDYQVKLSGSSEPSQEEEVGTYAFRVLTDK